MSPSIGANLLIKGLLNKDVEIISLSTYFAATKWKGNDRKTKICVTKAIKKRIFIGSTKEASSACSYLKEVIKEIGVICTILPSALAAEGRSITTYVHPPLFLNKIALTDIFFGEGPQKSMYKLYPEGPITPMVMSNLLSVWKEITGFLQSFDIKRFNLLKFLNDDNYPVPEEMLSRTSIEDFMNVDRIKQEYLLYVRYTALLIDPFSKPDQEGRYFEFSRVPLERVKRVEGRWEIPRVPLEDYKKLKLMSELAYRVNQELPVVNELVENFEEVVSLFSEKHRLHFDMDVFQKQLDRDLTTILNHTQPIQT
ncbi:opine metallophore biosynthesis dehydrogenase [Alkalihalophilus lindianensis]|uniref:Opine metallophore biosynthesis dehydrogenase n=1 Tax=Alkalihalophilus lindianensis TaxID=1630542 RepID=A0ABU3XE07_9BACI|nr:opine metallophore biosynthesis dehydrogenase [Alkalihalophilus lindianensis]MDV2686116.1 opine metallophore biosynthesis dehydrogenase [Alkalihalophilus lindianensis]